jgi:hypothetical protein
MVSEVCEAFGCTPDEALRQDWGLVTAIFDYRAANQAVKSFNDKDGFTVLERNPQLIEVLARMARAQRGEPLDAPGAADEGKAIAQRYMAEQGEADGDTS